MSIHVNTEGPVPAPPPNQSPSAAPQQPNPFPLPPTPTLLFPHSHQGYSQKHMKQLMQELRFKQKMQAINRKKGKYKRSTNNCHKKYIGILKNLLFLKLSSDKKDYILEEYNQYRNSRVYYFIILCYLKWYLDRMDIRWIFQHFCQQVQGKIGRYRLEINTTNNSNFIRFRKDEIIEMEYSIQSINYFLRGNVEQSIRVLYQKNKYIIIKRNEYLRTMQIIRELEQKLEVERTKGVEGKMAGLKLDQVYGWKRDIDFQELEDLERNVKMKAKEESGNEDDWDSKEEEEIEEQRVEERPKQRWQEKQIPKRDAVKVQEKTYEQPSKYPLLSLQDSYQAMTSLNWYSWIIQKQKMLEFTIKKREAELNLTSELKEYALYGNLMFNNQWINPTA